MNKKKAIVSLLVIFIIMAVSVFNCFVINPKQLVVRKEIIRSEKIDKRLNNITVAYFTDLYYGNGLNDDLLDKLIDKIDRYNPDVLIFGGDLLDGDLSDEETENLIQKLKDVRISKGKYAVFGEKDNGQAGYILQSADFRILDNSNIRVYADNSFINLVGFSIDYKNAYEGVNEDSFTFVISHYPDNVININKEKTDYILSGHSLGGQMNLPLISLLNRPTGAEKYFRGKNIVEGKTLDISNGVGMKNKRARLLADSELVIYKLVSIS